MIRSVLSKRLRQFATTTPSAAYPVAAYPVVSSSRSNEQQLRSVFDSPEIATSSTTSSTGLFLQPRLESPADFPALSERTILRAKLIVQKICLPPKGSHDSVEQVERAFLTMVKDLDRLSDLLCGVIDLAELVRNVHPEKGWNEGANEAYEGLCEYMNELNTNVVLYTALKSLHTLLPASTPTKSPQLFAAYAVATPFLRDFEKSGIHLPTVQREKFVTLSSDIIQLGRKFLLNAGEPKPGVEVEFGEIEEAFGEGFTRQVFEGTVGRKKSIEPTSWAGRVIARQHPDEAVRRRMHVGANATDESHVEVLEDLLMTRSRLAQLVGRESWGEVALEDKMAKTPRNVMGFLEKLNQENLPLARADLRVLQAAKKSDIGGYGSAKINAWDKDFYTDYSATSSPLPDISPFFSLGTCFSGLSKLFTSLYGIRFEVEDVAPGEIWVEGVRKLRVIDEDEGRIGTIYCDLFDREGKQSGAAHYTVRCSRRIDDDFADSDFTPDGMGMIDGVGIPRADMEGLETNGVRWRGREGVHQEPIIVLVCGFGNSGSESSKAKVGPTLLQWHEVETLFHEMGHAIHSMIGRTDYHNVSGTRCATDFVELPSILMEHLIASPTVLSSFARHHEKNTPLPQFLLEGLLKDRTKFSALETSNQIMMAALDQKFHSDLPLQKSFISSRTGRFDTDKVMKQVHEEFNVIPHAAGTAFQTSFGHLFGYGSTYYSYLFDRAIAAKIYRLKFAKDPINRERGEEFKQGILKWGGGKDCWEMVGGIVESEAVMRGDEEAMMLVGEWGIEEGRS